jgi:uncharacterized repeat protein (TIGR03803 family)
LKTGRKNPLAELVQATDGNLYGTTFLGGANNSGTIFKISLGGTLTTLYSFCAQPGCTDGTEPTGGLLQATNGILYGTTSAGGTEDYGTVFSLAAGLNPFVESLPTTGEVGTKVTILGTNLTRATGVNFNGTAAAFAVVSSSEITTAVPTGATTGTVEVTTPGGTLSSNVFFRVKKRWFDPYLIENTGRRASDIFAGTGKTITNVNSVYTRQNLADQVIECNGDVTTVSYFV